VGWCVKKGGQNDAKEGALKRRKTKGNKKKRTPCSQIIIWGARENYIKSKQKHNDAYSFFKKSYTKMLYEQKLAIQLIKNIT
jgi:hypothetical protein